MAQLDLGRADPLAITRAEQQVTGRVKAAWVFGSEGPGEVVWTRELFPVLLSAGIVEALQELSCTGFSAYPVDLKGKRGEGYPGYFGLAVEGRCGPLTASRSERVMKEYPGGFFPVLRGLYFDEGSWDGSDIFMSSDPTGFIFVTDRVKEILRKVKNVRWESLDQFEELEKLMRSTPAEGTS